MHLPLFVVSHRILLQAVGDDAVFDDHRILVAHRFIEQLYDVEQFACIAAAVSEQSGSLAQFELLLAEQTVTLCHALDQIEQIITVERFERIYLAA